MAITTTPEGTTIIHALALARIVAERAAAVPFGGTRLKVPAQELLQALPEARGSVFALEGVEKHVSHKQLGDAIVEALRQMAQAGMIPEMREHEALPEHRGLQSKWTLQVAGEIDLWTLTVLVQKTLRGD